MSMENTTIILIVVLGGATFLLGCMTYFGKGHSRLKQWEPAAQILSPIVLIMTVMVLSGQLGHIQDQNEQFRRQNELQRNVASKGAIQALNEVILSKNHDDDFLLFIFPGLLEPPDPNDKVEVARRSMMAFSLMNSLEMLYLTQREHKEISREDLKRLLRLFTTNVRGVWTDEFATVYHPDFQEIVNDVFDEKS